MLSDDHYEYFEKDKVLGFLGNLFTYLKKVFGMNDKDCSLMQTTKILGILLLLSFLNSILGNYFTLFFLVNGFFVYNYLKAKKKDVLDKAYTKASDLIKMVESKIPKYEESQ